MKNKEKYAKEIINVACSGYGIALIEKSGHVVPCDGVLCSTCLFNAHDCREQIRKWAESEYIEKPVISKRNIVILDYFRSNLKYIVRDENGKLFAYEAQPRKEKTYWKCNRGNCLLLNKQLNIDFPMIKWSDEEPWLIEDLKKLDIVEKYN